MLNKQRNRIIEQFTNVWKANDLAHRVTHFMAVEECGNSINLKLELGFDPKLIQLVAFFHDMFAWSRNNHHEMSAQWVISTDHPILANLSPRERSDVYWGCLQHRASFKGIFANQFAELMNAADREIPGNVIQMLNRAHQFRLAKGMSGDEAQAGAIAHIKEKFGTGGYARYPDLYLKAFGDELAAQRIEIDNL